jgi:hypothetical protein
VSSIGNVADREEQIRNVMIYFNWVDLSHYSTKSSIAAAGFLLSCNSSSPSTLLMCSVNARWLPIDLWIIPSQSASIFDSHPNPLDLMSSLAGQELEPRPIDIGIDRVTSLSVNLSNLLGGQWSRSSTKGRPMKVPVIPPPESDHMIYYITKAL